MPPEKREPFLKKVYLYIMGLGLMLFGVFAFFYREYDHPFYGHINLGEYHKYIGACVLMLSIAFMRYIRTRP